MARPQGVRSLTKMMRKAQCGIRLSAALLVALAGLLSLATPVFAIANPASASQIRAVNAYRDLLETGDIGILIDEYIDYAALPTETADAGYIIILLDTTGAQIKSTTPVPFTTNANKGYRRGAAWIYFSATEVTSLGVVWGSAYTIKISGNPALTWVPGPVPSSTSTPGSLSWSILSGSTQEHAELAQRIVTLAAQYATAWPLTLMVTQTSPGVTKLDTNGQQYFLSVIPGCALAAPDAFSSTLLAPIIEDLTYSSTFNGTVANLGGTITGSPFTLILGPNNINVTGLGTLTVTLSKGVAGTASTDVCTVAGTPVTIVAGTNIITTTTALGNIVITLTSTTTQSNILTNLIGTPLDMTALGAAFGMSRFWVSSIGWFFGMGLFLYYVVKYLGTKVALIFCDALIVFGGLLGMLPLLLTVGLFIIAGVLTGFVLFYNRSSA